MESEEFRLRHAPPPSCDPVAAQALTLLNRLPRIVDVGAQTLGAGSHAYDALVNYCAVEIIGFDPLQERLAQRAEAEGTDHVTLLPYAVADGARHTLHINNDDATSSLFPLNVEGNKVFNHLSELHTVRVESLDTKTLDDVLPIGPVDFLKLDVQGAELMVLKGAKNTLKNTGVIHCEVEFYPIYEGQPLFHDVVSYLKDKGFYFIDFVEMSRYHYLNGQAGGARDRLLWADAVFFRDTAEPELRASQALIASVVYKKLSLAAHLLGSGNIIK